MRSFLGAWRRIGGAAALAGAMALSAAYGYFLVPRRWFPFDLLVKRHGPISRLLASHVRAHDASGNMFPSVEDLKAKPELRGDTPASGRVGVLLHDRSRAENGLNFFTSAHAPAALLMDMDGAILRKWSVDAGETFVRDASRSRSGEDAQFFRDAELLPDGGVLALLDNIGIVRLDLESRVVWSFPVQAHHDLFVDFAGVIWALAHERRVIPGFRNAAVQDDVILSLSPDGKLLRRISVLDCFRQSSYAAMLATLPPEGEDVLQTNSIVVLDGSLAGRSPAFRRGNLLISSRSLGMVAVLDPDQNRVLWALRGLWRGQESVQLAAGHVLLFDDLGSMRKTPRVLEVDPFSQEVLWSFGTTVDQPMLPGSGGSVERLRGGNTLITETDAGRVREVTLDNRVVWEFANPNRVGKNQEFVAFIYLMERVPSDLPFLSKIQVPNSKPPAPTGG
ncbi:MAG TPA: arylsulfotransferase family protein [Thermoanaerobaculia bacterium]